MLTDIIQERNRLHEEIKHVERNIQKGFFDWVIENVKKLLDSLENFSIAENDILYKRLQKIKTCVESLLASETIDLSTQTHKDFVPINSNSDEYFTAVVDWFYIKTLWFWNHNRVYMQFWDSILALKSNIFKSVSRLILWQWIPQKLDISNKELSELKSCFPDWFIKLYSSWEYYVWVLDPWCAKGVSSFFECIWDEDENITGYWFRIWANKVQVFMEDWKFILKNNSNAIFVELGEDLYNTVEDLIIWFPNYITVKSITINTLRQKLKSIWVHDNIDSIKRGRNKLYRFS